jgi:hypothetical protein
MIEGLGNPVPRGAVPRGAVPSGAFPTGAVPTGAFTRLGVGGLGYASPVLFSERLIFHGASWAATMPASKRRGRTENCIVAGLESVRYVETTSRSRCLLKR